jgi:hypothetical protein
VVGLATRWWCRRWIGWPAPCPGAREIGDCLVGRGIRQSPATRFRPDRSGGQGVLNILATFAEFEIDLLRMRTREGMAALRAKGKLRGKQPKLSVPRERA